MDKRKFMVCSIALALILEIILAKVNPNGSIVMAKNENSTDNYVGLAEAKDVANNFIKSMTKGTSEFGWSKTTEITDEKIIFDLNDNISSYLFYLKDKGKVNGYVVVSADKCNAPILEYSSSNKIFFELEMETTKKLAEKENGVRVKRNNSKIYDLGSTSYVVSHKLEDNEICSYDISSNNKQIDIKKLDKDIQDKNTNNSNVASNKEAWKQLKENKYALSGESSSPPDSGKNIITDPKKYEKGYNFGGYKTIVIRGDHNYFTMKQFHEGGVCGSTAAVNLCYYWYCRDRKYRYLCNGTWKNTFNTFYNELGENTFIFYEAAAIKNYLNRSGKKFDVEMHIGTHSGRDIVDNIDYQYPVVLLMNNHYYYGNHYCLAVGYQEFEYKKKGKKSYSTYILIADGHIKELKRYVWGGCTGNWFYISAKPSGRIGW